MRADFLLDPDVVFLNHGSFGACPRAVFDRYQQWQRELERQPVEFLARRLTGLLAEAREALAAYLGASPDDLVFVPNATSGVNLAARSLRLDPGDEVLGTTLEYGACDLAWSHVCGRAGATYVRADVPLPVERAEEIVDAVLAGVTPRTRVLFVSHVTSDTAIVLPVAELVAEARRLGLTTVVDGAHAPGQVDLDLEAVGADVYSGNCHKWLCAPKGSGFLHVRPELQGSVDALVVSWGYGDDASFRSRHEWQGTRDPSAYLTVPDAIAWVERHDDAARGHALAVEAQRRLTELLGTRAPAAPELIGRMAAVPVEGVDADALKERLYSEHRIEVPVRPHEGGALLRASFAAYNDESDLDSLVVALERELRTES